MDNPTAEIFKAVNDNGNYQRTERGKESKVNKPIIIPDKTTLKKHLIEVGRRIQIDAENELVPDPRSCMGITITAKISPLDSVTTIKYEIEEYADHRMSKVEDEEV